MLLFAALMSVSFTACGNDDDDDPIENGRNDDNGTGIVNNGGNGDEKLTPDDEKNFLDETARLFLSYFDANDFQELVNVSKQLETVSDDDKVFDKWAEGFLSNTLTGIEEAHASSYNYDMYLKISYYDRLVVASNFNGKFSASYNGKWKKDGESNDLILSFTDKDNVEWVMTVKKSGNIKGKIHASNSSSGSYVDKYKYSEQRYKNYIEIPENVNVIVTRQGKEQINIKLNVASMDIKDGQYDITSSLNATATGNVVQEVLSYINNHYTQDLSISGLARHFGISESWLAHEFVRFTNRSVYNYILYRRVMLSRRLMLGEDSLNTIAYQCGFSDYSGFLRAFTKIAGISPSKYRKNLSQYQPHEL